MNRMLIAAAGNLWGICGDRPLRVGDLGQILARMSGMLKKQGPSGKRDKLKRVV